MSIAKLTQTVVIRNRHCRQEFWAIHTVRIPKRSRWVAERLRFCGWRNTEVMQAILSVQDQSTLMQTFQSTTSPTYRKASQRVNIEHGLGKVRRLDCYVRVGYPRSSTLLKGSLDLIS